MNSEFFKAVNVSFSYYRKPLCLSDVNFSMQKFDKILLLSSNEMGKTTFLSVMSSFDNTYFGKILLNGKELKSIDDKDKNFSLLPTLPVLFENKTVLDNLKITSEQKFDENKLNNLLSKYDLIEFSNIKVKKLNDFEKKLLAIARSELKNPTILFLDDQFQDLPKEEIGNRTKLKNIYREILDDSTKSIIFTIDKETYLSNRDLFNNSNIAKILYLIDSKVFEFKDIASFESDFVNINQLEFLSSDWKQQKANIYKFNDDYYVGLSDTCQLKIYSDNLIKLKTNNLTKNDDEDIILVFRDNIILDEITEIEFNEKLVDNSILIFSDIDGSRIL